MTLDRARIAAIAGLVLVTASCSSDDEAPPDSSVLAAIEAALCESFGPAGSMLLDGRVYDMSDCPP